MAELILSTAARALGARFLPAGLRTIGAAILQAGASAAGRRIDDAIFTPARRIEGPRLTDLHIQGSTEGASMPSVYGRVRIAGQVIWAAKFKEHESTETSGGKGGPRVSARTFQYTLSFAVGLCEGEIARVGRIWANGQALDLSTINWRLYKGGEDQTPDPLIEAIEGPDEAPAYRGLAYVVFEDLPLEQFGNVMPQLSFEVVRPAPSSGPRLEDMARGVCLIPGSGEFVYATTPVRRVLGPGREVSENVHAVPDRANFEIALDQLAADLPNVETVLLVVSWFGTDLRCASCEIRPGAEIAEKTTKPQTWRVNGVARDAAHIVSQTDGGPAYGGTPSDLSVIEAIAALKARGYKVGLYPFMLMDIAADNELPDPYGAPSQAAYPWRGRVTLDPAPGEPGSPDKTAAAATQIAAFTGAAEPGDFGSNANGVTYAGPSEWSYRRFILHHAKLAQIAGGVDVFILGSELRALTTARASANTYPFVGALKTLAADVRAMLGGETTLTYAADWSEYFGCQPQDGSGDVFFHLDPLWSDANIDCVGIDWYAPLTDWRDGAAHADAAIAEGPHDPAYLEGRIEAGENYDWYYASDEDRAAQTRTPITDGAYAKPWVFRAKDIRAWLQNAHYDRPGGVENASPTDWIPHSKPIWFIELGCPAVDKGANAPNLFIDPKSGESALPPFSSGARDDLIQRRVLEAYLRHWADAEDIVDPDGIFLWCWDARPHPEFPARGDVWSDAASWRLGHWLSGRVGLAELAAVAGDLCARAGVTDADVAALSGAVGGFVVDSPVSPRDALAPLMLAYDFNAVERDGTIVFAHRRDAVAVSFTRDALTQDTATANLARADSAETPVEARVQFIDPSEGYRIASASARRRDAAEGGVVSLDAPLTMDAGQAEALAKRILAAARAGAETAEIGLAPQTLALEPGDLIELEPEGAFEIVRIEDAETRRLVLRRALSAGAGALYAPEIDAPALPAIAPSPEAFILDVPPLPGAEDDQRPLVALYAEPWLGVHDVYAGPDVALLTRRAQIEQPALHGETLWDLWPGPIGRWDEGNRIRVRMTGALDSVTKAALLNGANTFAVETGLGWEILQARNAVLVGENEYELSGFLRGQQDTAAAMAAPTPAGARIVKLDARLARMDVAAHEHGEPLLIAAPPFARDAHDAGATQFSATIAPEAARPFAPVFLRASRQADGALTLSWVRRARIGGDSWGAGEPPLGEPSESYRLDIFDGETIVRTVVTTSPAYEYGAADQASDFGAPPDSLFVRVAQLAGDGRPGREAEALLAL